MSNDRLTEVKSIQQEPEREQRIFSFKVTQLIWLFLGILEALIVLRIGLKLIGANPASPIVALIYGVTYLFLFPFEGMVATPSAGSSVLELSSLFAMVIYALIAWAEGDLDRAISGVLKPPTFEPPKRAPPSQTTLRR